MTDNTTQNVKPDAMNAAAVLLLQEFIDEIASGTAIVTKLAGDAEDWSLSISLAKLAPAPPKAPIEAPATAIQFKPCPMCAHNTFLVEGKSCMSCGFVDD